MWIRRNEFEQLKKRVCELEQLMSVNVPCEPYTKYYPMYGGMTWSHVSVSLRDVVQRLAGKAKLKGAPPEGAKSARLI